MDVLAIVQMLKAEQNSAAAHQGWRESHSFAMGIQRPFQTKSLKKKKEE